MVKKKLIGIQGDAIEGAADIPSAQFEKKVKVTENRDKTLAALHDALDVWFGKTWPIIEQTSTDERAKMSYLLNGVVREEKTTIHEVLLSPEGIVLLDQIFDARRIEFGTCGFHTVRGKEKRVLACLINETLGDQNNLRITDLAALTGYKKGTISEAVGHLRKFFNGLEKWWTIDGGGRGGISLVQHAEYFFQSTESIDMLSAREPFETGND